MALSHRNIFLIDGLGAFFSASVLGYVLLNFQGLFGMPQEMLFFLMIVACVLSLYSLSCHVTSLMNWQPFLLFIAISNTIYCLVSIGLVIYHFERLTSIGICYFALEVIIVGVLVLTEFRIAVQRKSGDA